MNDIDVVVAIVTYRSADLAIDCLRSIEAERSTPGISIRVIVVDNASGDAPSIKQAITANNWSWVMLVEAPKNGGFAYGNNVAFRRAYDEGPPAYIHMLNPDTLVRKGSIGALVRFLETHPDVGIAGSSLENQDGSDWPIAFRFPTILSELDLGLQFGLVTRVLQPWVAWKHMSPIAQLVDWIPGASMMVRRAVLDAIGGLDENYFLYFEETDFCFRASKAGFPTWYVPESRVMHIAGQSTKVTSHKSAPERLPAYWFESRRRFFAVTYGVRYAIAVDVVTLLAHGLGALKRMILRRSDHGVPHFLEDITHFSIFWTKNRTFPSIKHFVPHP